MTRYTMTRLWTASFLLALLPATALSAQSAFSAEDAAAAVRPAFAYASELSAKEGSDSRQAGRTIAIDLGALAEDPAQLSVELPDGRFFVAFRTASWTEEGDRRYWSGELHEGGSLEKEAAGTLSLSAEGGIVAGSLRAGGESFEILPLGEGVQQLLPAAAHAAGAGHGAHCEAHGEKHAEGFAADGDGDGDAALLDAALLDASLLDGGTDKFPPSVVDVLVVFPRSLAANATQLAQTRARIGGWFADANLALANSGLSHRYRVLYSGQLFGEQPPAAANADEATSLLGFYWLMTQPAEVVALRDSWQADLVALFVPQDNNMNCGAAQFGDPANDQYASIDLGCASGEYLVAHELGHLLGMRHAADEYGGSGLPSPFPFSYGYDNTNQLVVNGQRAATVMACNGNNNGAPNPTTTGIQCNRIPYFSSSSVLAGGVSIGNASADNAQIARRQMYLTSLRRPTLATGNLPPRVTLVRPQGSRAQTGQYLTLEARAWDTEDGNLANAVQWTSNRRGYLGTGSLLRVYSSLLGAETITATVYDSGSLSYARSASVFFESQVVTEGAIWHDPASPGRFLSFNKNINNDWLATWMAYEGTSPVWYASSVVPVASNGAFSSSLYRYTRNVSTGVQTATYYASLSIAVETERQIRLTISPVSGAAVDLMLEPYTRVSGPGGYWSLVGGQVDPGWLIFRGPTAFGPTGQETRMMITFDGSQPAWVFGLGSFTGFPTQPFGLFMYRPTPATMTNNYQIPSSSNIGNLVFTNQNTVYTSIYFPSGNSFIRPAQTVDGFVIR